MTLAIDFDGVIHRYSQGWRDGTIYDPPMPGALDGLRQLMDQDAVFIHTTREPEQVMPWLESHGFDVTIDERCGKCLGAKVAPGERPCRDCDGSGLLTFWNGRDQLLVTNRKLPATVYLDDRAIRFENWDQALTAVADPHAWVQALTAAWAEVERLRAGEEPHHDDYTQATPAQWIWHWNQATPEQRLQMAASIQRASAAESQCIMGDHASLRERNEQLRQALTRGLVLANELIPVSNTVGIGRRLWEALELRASDVAVGDPMTQVSQGAPSDATGDSSQPPAPASNPDESALDAAYRERAHLVAFLAVLYPAVIVIDGDPNAPGWALVYVNSPTGQLSWHLSGDDLDLFPHVERAEPSAVTWDNHTTDEKYGRIRQLTADLAAFPMLPWSTAAEAVVPDGGCGPACAITHLYDGSCTVDPALEDVIGGGRDNGRVTWCWRCAEDDGCGHLSLGHTTAAAARRSYDRHRAKECPRTDPFDTPTTPADGGVISPGFTVVGEGRSVCDLTVTQPKLTRTVRVTLDNTDARLEALRLNPTDGGEQS